MLRGSTNKKKRKTKNLTKTPNKFQKIKYDTSLVLLLNVSYYSKDRFTASNYFAVNDFLTRWPNKILFSTVSLLCVFCVISGMGVCQNRIRHFWRKIGRFYLPQFSSLQLGPIFIAYLKEQKNYDQPQVKSCLYLVLFILYWFLKFHNSANRFVISILPYVSTLKWEILRLWTTLRL